MLLYLDQISTGTMTATLASMTRNDPPTTVNLNKVAGGWSDDVPENTPKDLYCVRYQAQGIDEYDLLDTRDDALTDVLAILRADEERDSSFYRKKHKDTGAVLLQKRRKVSGDLIQLTEQ